MKTTARFSPLASGFVSLLFVGCIVPQNRYDDAVTRLHAEQTARRADASELLRTKAELARLNQALGTREQSLTAREGELSQAKLDSDRVSTERDDAIVMVEQLRGELARVGDHLREFSDQKRELEGMLAEADARAKRLDRAEKTVDAKVLLVRDVSLALGDWIAKGVVAVTVVDGKPAVRLDAHEVFSQDGAAILPTSAAIFERLATTLSPRTETHVELGDRSVDSVTPEDRIVRLQHVADLLSGKGLGLDRIGFAVAPAGEGAPSMAGAPPATKTTLTAPSWRDGVGSLEIAIDVDAPG